MRLTCPNCGAEYEVPEGLIPAAGKHVQCSACHTRWFMRGAVPSEDQILHRLETIGPARSRPTLVAVPTAEPASAEPLDFAWEAPDDQPKAETEAPPPEASEPPAEQPPLLRSAPRLELGAGKSPVQPARPARRSRFGRGLLVALGIACLAAASYLWRDRLAQSVPAAAPALEAYGQAVDAAREGLDRLATPGK